MSKKKDLFDDFISSMNEQQQPIIKTHQPTDEKDSQQEVSDDAAVKSYRRGRPLKEEGHREPEYISKTFRISKKSAHVLDEIAYSQRRPLKDVLEEAVSLIDDKYSISAWENEQRTINEIFHG